MKKLKERFGYYFEFKNTINGTDYFMRGLAGVLFIIPMAIFIGIGLALLETIPVLAGFLFLLGSLFSIPLIWFSLATTYKRINAFFPGKAGWLTALTFILSIIVEALNPVGPDAVVPLTYSPVYIVFLLISLIWSVYLLFGNSPTAKDKHIG
tara:strand:- start:46 stop:501 length:456 start_codon:yes stop_codon:yes gene_type:complete